MPKPDPARERGLVAELNALCRSWAHGGHHLTREQERVQARTAALDRALKQAAAYLPAGRAWSEADAARRALEAEIFRPSPENPHLRIGHETTSQNDRFRRIESRIYDSVKALGLSSCLGPPPPSPRAG